MSNRPKRMWVNQPSTLQPHHDQHGTNVLAYEEYPGSWVVYFLDGSTISQQMLGTALSEGWQEPAQTKPSKVEVPRNGILSTQDIWEDEGIMAANARLGASMEDLVTLTRAVETAVTRKQGAQNLAEPVRWYNGCDRTVPKALRFLANHERPAGGETPFNSAHLFQLADEIEHMATMPLYPAPQPKPAGEAAKVADSTAKTFESQVGDLRKLEDLSAPRYRLCLDSSDIQSVLESKGLAIEDASGIVVVVQDADYAEVWVTVWSRPFDLSATYARVA